MSTTPSLSPTRITTAEQENVKALQYALGHALEESPTYMHGIARTLHSLGVVAAAPPVSDTTAATITPDEPWPFGGTSHDVSADDDGFAREQVLGFVYFGIAARECVTVICSAPGIARVPSHWLDRVEREAAPLLAALGLTVTDETGAGK